MRSDREVSLPEGFLVGHATAPPSGTGCTVVMCPGGTRGGVDVRGGGTGTRELEPLAPLANAEGPSAVLLTGGSAPAMSLTPAGDMSMLGGQRFARVSVQVPIGDERRRLPIPPGSARAGHGTARRSSKCCSISRLRWDDVMNRARTEPAG